MDPCSAIPSPREAVPPGAVPPGAVPQEPLRIGMVGGGMIGQLAHLATFATVPDCRVVALAELRPALGRAVAERFDIAAVYPDHRAMLRDPAIDAVVVVTRRPATGPVVLDALRAGRHVLSEKPMAHTVAQAETLVAAAAAAGRTYAIGCMKRHDAGVEIARDLLDTLRRTGAFGRPVLVQGWCFAGDIGVARDGFSMTGEQRPDGLDLWPIAPDWVPAPRRDAYAWFLNVNIHLLNLVRFLTGETPRVVASDIDRPGSRTVGLAFDRCPGVLEFEEFDAAPWHEGVLVRFERGSVRLDLPPPLTPGRSAAVTVTDGSAPATRVAVPADWAFRRQAAAFVGAVRHGTVPRAAGADAVADMRLAEAAWAVALGRTAPADLDPDLVPSAGSAAVGPIRYEPEPRDGAGPSAAGASTECR